MALNPNPVASFLGASKIICLTWQWMSWQSNFLRLIYNPQLKGQGLFIADYLDREMVVHLARCHMPLSFAATFARLARIQPSFLIPSNSTLDDKYGARDRLLSCNHDGAFLMPYSWERRVKYWLHLCLRTVGIWSCYKWWVQWSTLSPFWTLNRN